MKVCVLTHGYPRTKNDYVAPFMRVFALAMVEAGNKVVVLTPHTEGLKKSEKSFKIISYKYIYPESLHLLGYSKTINADVKLKKNSYILIPFMILFGTISLIKAIRKEKIDVISVHWILPNGLIAYMASKITKTPYTISFAGSDVYVANSNPLFKTAARIIGNNASALVTSNKRLMNAGLSVGITNVKTALIPYPADVSDYKPLKRGLSKYRTKHNITDRDLILFALGRFVYKKGFTYLIKAMPQILSKHKNVKLLLGGDGPLKQEFEKAVDSLNLKNKVIFTGMLQKDELIYYYNLCSVFVIPSVIDNKGNFDGATVASVEAMACGKPLIVSNIVGLENVIKKGKHALVVPQKNSKALARAAIELLNSKQKRRKMGTENMKLVRSKLSTLEAGEKYTKLFRSAIQTN